MPEFSFSSLEPYLDSLVPERHHELQKMEAYAAEKGFPIVGPASGMFCYMVARMVGARSVFELGSGYGYSTAWFARAVDENGGGVVHHVVWDEDLSKMARQHLAALGYPATDSGAKAKTMIDYTVGEAVAAFKQHEGPFDLVFNDIDKQAYPETIEPVTARLRKGGAFITDNVVWSGRVLEGDDSDQTKAIMAFNSRMASSEDWATTVVPIRDGLLLALRR
ncbi:MAG TPA: O-methyltransferase [Fimbriimonadaceae bacterium]|nr:O-methyltransferase [Fimbriimonadaceae bacterium]